MQSNLTEESHRVRGIDLKDWKEIEDVERERLLSDLYLRSIESSAVL